MNKKTSVAGLSLRDLEYIQSIAQQGHFGTAATICGVSQPAISQQVLKLEARLGFSLFERQGKQVSLTPSGRAFLRKADVILAEARELLDLSIGLSNNLEGELRVGVIPTLGPYLLPLILRSIRSNYPNVKLSLIEEPTPVLEQMLSNRELDATLIATAPKGRHLDAIDLFFEPFVLACPIDMARKPQQPVSSPDILNSELVLLSEEHCLRDQTMALCDLSDLRGERVASSLEMLRHLVALGEGSALFPILSVAGSDRFGGLVTLHPIMGKDFGRQVRLVWRVSDPRARYLKKLGEFVQAQMGLPDLVRHLSLSG